MLHSKLSTLELPRVISSSAQGDFPNVPSHLGPPFHLVFPAPHLLHIAAPGSLTAAQEQTSSSRAWQEATPATVTGELTLQYADDFVNGQVRTDSHAARRTDRPVVPTPVRARDPVKLAQRTAA